LRIRHRGSGVLRGFCEGCTPTLARALSLWRKGFRNSCEGCEGLARAYTCERGCARFADVSCISKPRGQSDSCATREKPSQPSHFSLNRLKEKNKNPRNLFSKPSLNPRNPRRQNFSPESQIRPQLAAVRNSLPAVEAAFASLLLPPPRPAVGGESAYSQTGAWSPAASVGRAGSERTAAYRHRHNGGNPKGGRL
jgi:hypothetical protein